MHACIHGVNFKNMYTLKYVNKIYVRVRERDGRSIFLYFHRSLLTLIAILLTKLYCTIYLPFQQIDGEEHESDCIVLRPDSRYCKGKKMKAKNGNSCLFISFVSFLEFALFQFK